MHMTSCPMSYSEKWGEHNSVRAARKKLAKYVRSQNISSCWGWSTRQEWPAWRTWTCELNPRCRPMAQAVTRGSSCKYGALFYVGRLNKVTQVPLLSYQVWGNSVNATGCWLAGNLSAKEIHWNNVPKSGYHGRGEKPVELIFSKVKEDVMSWNPESHIVHLTDND